MRALSKPRWPQLRQVMAIGTPCNAYNNPSNAGWMRRLFGGERPAFDVALSAADGRVSGVGRRAAGGGRSKTLITLAACGVRLRSFPMTLDKVIAGLDATV